MTYSPTTWQDHITQTTAANMNNIEAGIVAAVPAVRAQPGEDVDVRAWRVEPATAGFAPFELHVTSDENTGGGAGTYNHAAWIGWNSGWHGGSPTTGKPGMFMGFEDNYYDPARSLAVSEWYVQSYGPDGVTRVRLRPFYAQVANGNGEHNAIITHDIGYDGDGQFTLYAGDGVGAGAPSATIVFNITGALADLRVPVYAKDGMLTTNIGGINSSGAAGTLFLRPGSAGHDVVFQTFDGAASNLTISNAGDLTLRAGAAIQNFGAGFKVGGDPAHKIAFYGGTPIVQPSGTPAAATDPATTQTLVNDLRTKLLALGLIG